MAPASAGMFRRPNCYTVFNIVQVGRSIYNDSFFLEDRDLVMTFFSLGFSMGFSKLEFLGHIASFERRLRGAAPTPLALPYSFRT